MEKEVLLKTNEQENENKKIETENKMGVMSINKLLITMSLPVMISMLVQALYNVVDSVFVARVSEEALTAISLAFPIQMLMIAVGTGTGVGMNAVLSKALGEKNSTKANQTALNGIFLAMISYVVFAIVGLLIARSFFASQTDNQIIVNYGNDYLLICCVFSFGLFSQMIFERLLQATGKTMYTMVTQAVGAIINIILDPILIFGLFGFPKMEVAGAAAATVIGQIVAGVLAIILNCKRNHEIGIRFKGFKPSIALIKKIYGVGLPSILMQAIGSIMIYGMDLILATFSSTAVAVFGVYFRLQSFVFMPVFGLNIGMVSIVAYNYGAKNKKRVIQTIKLSVVYAVSIMLLGFLVFQLFPETLLSFFSASDQMIQIGIPALRKISFAFLFAGYCIIITSSFQALGNGLYSLIVSILRQLVILLPTAYLLARFFTLDQVWWAIPIAEIMSVTATTILLVIMNKKVIQHI